ncbi:FAD-containing monooxygenase EthA [Nocardia sp. MDA0666]|uniref:flavin-containing monooxygenase n=1 Tax=Nocardia sp. MDA0666 TaxID=2135448 RepID=UPI000D12E289|nr:NAD(P)/FAD-dependent oxidoreductase [Nocardia sp. MDA0666]PSR68844.1 FAD-containing monooxygenase EthA [Nocardia sp. MDA0666]
MIRHVDVLIIGAGISGIGVACHLVREKTGRSFAILERRYAIGGTWDLFRYPGIRSDSDMLTFGYGFRPWNGTKVLSDGAGIREYVEDTAREYGVTDHIMFGRKGIRAEFDSATALWTVEALVEDTGITETWTARFLVGATGYYDYDRGFRPNFPGENNFRGQIVHPQHWPQDLDYEGKKVVVIGSGATAITLVPAMADKAAHITMLQRSPTYIQTLPAEDPVARVLGKARVPHKLAYRLGRTRNIALQRASFELSRRFPTVAKILIRSQIKLQVGNKIDMRHFTPDYNPWDQRLCVIPDGDLFEVLRTGRADIVTDTIATFTPAGIRTSSGRDIDADIVVTATGLNIQVAGGADILVDGTKVDLATTALYKGVVISGVPNHIIVLGYTNASWTLKADLAAEYFCRVLNTMRDNNHTSFSARAQISDIGEHSVMGESLTSGYIQRGDSMMPRQGTHGPWQVINSYYRDRTRLLKEDITDGILTFDRPVSEFRIRPADQVADRRSR